MKTFDKQEKVLRPLSELHLWENNPRTADEEDINRLIEQINYAGGLYKPLLCMKDGTILGGNQRFKALKKMGEKEAWVSLVEPKNKTEMLKIALSDNGRVGEFDIAMVKVLTEETDFNAKLQEILKLDTSVPMNVNEFLAAQTEQTLGKAGEKDVDTTKDKLDTYENGDTKQIVVFCTSNERDQMTAQIKELSNVFDVEGIGEVLLTVLREYAADNP